MSLLILFVLGGIIPLVIIYGALLAVVMIVTYVAIWGYTRWKRKAEDSNPTDLRPPTD